MSFVWVVAAGGIGSWLFGYATGANDVGNAFGRYIHMGVKEVEREGLLRHTYVVVSWGSGVMMTTSLSLSSLFLPPSHTGTAVGAKTLTMLQAVIIAGIFEFTGAIVLGRVSTATIAGTHVYIDRGGGVGAAIVGSLLFEALD